MPEVDPLVTKPEVQRYPHRTVIARQLTAVGIETKVDTSVGAYKRIITDSGIAITMEEDKGHFSFDPVHTVTLALATTAKYPYARRRQVIWKLDRTGQTASMKLKSGPAHDVELPEKELKALVKKVEELEVVQKRDAAAKAAEDDQNALRGARIARRKALIPPDVKHPAIQYNDYRYEMMVSLNGVPDEHLAAAYTEIHAVLQKYVAQPA